MCSCLSFLPCLSLRGATCTAEPNVVSQSSKSPSLPSFTGGARNFKGWQRKWKGTLFIRPWRETYRRSVSAPNRQRLLDMLNRRVAGRQSRTDWSEAGRQGQRERQKSWVILWCWRKKIDLNKDTAEGKRKLAIPHLCKSHLIFSLTEGCVQTRRIPVKHGEKKPWSVSLESLNWATAFRGGFAARSETFS